MAELFQEGNNKCGTSSAQRAFKLDFTSLDNCIDRCSQDSRCMFASTEMEDFCIGCKVLSSAEDGWFAYRMIRDDRRQLSEVVQLRAENVALKAALAQARRN